MAQTPLCSAPWTHLYVDVDGLVYLCCYNESHERPGSDLDPSELRRSEGRHPNTSRPLGHIAEQSLREIWESAYLEEIRANFKAGRFTAKQCWRCREGLNQGIAESALMMSEFNTLYRRHKRVPAYRQGPISLNIHLGNLCNLKCVMCVPKYSSRHAGKVIDPYTGNLKFDRSFQDALPYVEHINFGGGEPLINENLYRYLGMVKSSAQPITLSYITNLTVLSPELKKILPRLYKNLFRVSLDGVGKRYEEIRRGARWGNVLENLKHLARNREKYRVRVIHVLMCVFNSNYEDIDAMLDLCLALNLRLGFHAVYFPEALSPFKSPPDVRARMHDHLGDVFARRKKDLERICTNHEILSAI